METVEKQFKDVPRGMGCHVDGDGNLYDFAFGLNMISPRWLANRLNNFEHGQTTNGMDDGQMMPRLRMTHSAFMNGIKPSEYWEN